MESDKKKRTSIHCKLCQKVLKYAGNTTNLRYHLQLSHRAEFLLLQRQPADKDKMKQLSTSTQLSVEDSFLLSTPMASSSPRWNQLTQSVCYFIAKDMQPIDTVNDTGFRKMLKNFEPRYIPPDWKTISSKYLPQMFETAKDRVKNLLNHATYYACTTDLWTSRAQYAYISLTVHYISEDFVLQSSTRNERVF